VTINLRKKILQMRHL